MDINNSNSDNMMNDVAERIANLTPNQLNKLKDEAMKKGLGQNDMKMVDKLRKKGITRKKMLKEIKDKKKENNQNSDKVEWIKAIHINESRKIKQIILSSNNFYEDCKRFLQTKEELDETQHSEWSIGPFENKKIKIIIDPSKECKGKGNRRLDKFLTVKNSGGAIFTSTDESITLEDFLEFEKLWKE